MQKFINPASVDVSNSVLVARTDGVTGNSGFIKLMKPNVTGATV